MSDSEEFCCSLVVALSQTHADLFCLQIGGRLCSAATGKSCSLSVWLKRSQGSYCVCTWCCRAGTSLTSKTSSSDPNREWGVVFDSPCVTKIYEAKFQADRGIATQFQGSLPCTNYDA